MRCVHCGGNGGEPGTWRPGAGSRLCTVCRGSGKVESNEDKIIVAAKAEESCTWDPMEKPHYVADAGHLRNQRNGLPDSVVTFISTFPPSRVQEIRTIAETALEMIQQHHVPADHSKCRPMSPDFCETMDRYAATLRASLT